MRRVEVKVEVINDVDEKGDNRLRETDNGNTEKEKCSPVALSLEETK